VHCTESYPNVIHSHSSSRSSSNSSKQNKNYKSNPSDQPKKHLFIGSDFHAALAVGSAEPQSQGHAKHGCECNDYAKIELCHVHIRNRVPASTRKASLSANHLEELKRREEPSADKAVTIKL